MMNKHGSEVNDTPAS